jgi:hypothetical protein
VWLSPKRFLQENNNKTDNKPGLSSGLFFKRRDVILFAKGVSDGMCTKDDEYLLKHEMIAILK